MAKAYLVGSSSSDQLMGELSLVGGVDDLVVGLSLVRVVAEETHCRRLEVVVVGGGMKER